MNVRATDRLWTLTDKEKETLRLIVRGHDAKSTARSLGLSVHTINERLRDARRKMGASSSREAARLLLEAEGGPGPELLGDNRIGEDAGGGRADQGGAPSGGAGRGSRLLWIGGSLMTLVLGLLALAALSPDASTPARTAPNPEVVEAARNFLTLIDQKRWDDSYRATAASFHKANTAKVWADTSEKVRVPLGAVSARTFLSQESVPTPPHGYEMVKFRTSFANKPDATEIVTLDREGGRWVIAGVYIE